MWFRRLWPVGPGRCARWSQRTRLAVRMPRRDIQPTVESKQTPAHCTTCCDLVNTSHAHHYALSRQLPGRADRGVQRGCGESRHVARPVHATATCLERTRTGTSQRRWTRRRPGERLDEIPSSLPCDDRLLLLLMHLTTQAELMLTSSRPYHTHALFMLSRCHTLSISVAISAPYPEHPFTAPCSSW